MWLFKRRDTRVRALVLGGFAGLFPLTFAAGTPVWTPAVQLPLALAAALGTGALVVRRRRNLPPDFDLARLAPAEQARLVAAGPPPDRTRLFVAFRRDWGSRRRLDVFVDGRHAGQLLPGTALLMPLAPGLRRVTACLDDPRTAVSETVNSIPGGEACFTVRSWGSRAVTLEIKRLPGIPLEGLQLVRPADGVSP